MKANDMNESLMATKTNQDVSTKSDKASYLAPALKAYGSINILTRNGNGSGVDGGNTAGMTKQSAPETKENIVRIGNHPLGIGLYLFDYKNEFRDLWGHGRQFGVMADEVESVMPEAVSLHSNGYKTVNYAMLGITHSTQ